MKNLYLLFLSLFSGSLIAHDSNNVHVLDHAALQELYEATRNKSTSPVATDNRARLEFWHLADRIHKQETFEKIFTDSEQKCFNALTNEIFASDSYKIQYKNFVGDPKVVNQYKKVSAILAKNKLMEKGVKYQDNPSYATFDAFLEVNRDISGEAIDWMIAGSMFLYYIRQIERQHREPSLLM